MSAGKQELMQREQIPAMGHDFAMMRGKNDGNDGERKSINSRSGNTKICEHVY
jgi:hypothetical protein